MHDEHLTPREIADELGVTVRTVQRWVADGRLPARRIGGRVRVARSSLASVTAAPNEKPSPAGRPIRRLLVANRGEIVGRVAGTARALDIGVVGVAADGDRPPDEVDGWEPIPDYLAADAIIDVARRAGADAVHPGYGFLSENADFARAVRAAGLTWIGPPPQAIEAMGDKAAARRTAAAHGVPLLPGYEGAAQDDLTLEAEAERIGFPLLVKPTGGGGGKGMRVVREAGELAEALASARREAHRSFGDDRLILERLLVGARHVEIQVLFDAHGGGVHLGERDCSTQRRNQKIVEEAPGPSVNPELRSRMGAAAVEVARAVGYEGAGTVEFLVDDDANFYFLEMNTRLQVEHPVTEAVTGRDLVADQLRIAAGEALGLSQADVRLAGHAIEVRLYAEDPEAGFLPAAGTLVRVDWPPEVRIDTGIRAGDIVSERYDPMLAKLIARGETRGEALDRLRAALGATHVLGVRTNIRFLRWLLDQPVMRDGEVRTDTIASLAIPSPAVPDDATWAAVAAAARDAGLLPDGAWGGAWRLNVAPAVRLRHGDEVRRVPVPPPGTEPAAALAATVQITRTVHADVEGQSLEFRLAPPPTVEEAVRHAAEGGDGHALLTAPMPGRVLALRAREGAPVRQHEPVVVLEAMKMEHAVVAPLAGTVSRLAVAEGQQVQRGDLLAEVSAADDRTDGGADSGADG